MNNSHVNICEKIPIKKLNYLLEWLNIKFVQPEVILFSLSLRLYSSQNHPNFFFIPILNFYDFEEMFANGPSANDSALSLLSFVADIYHSKLNWQKEKKTHTHKKSIINIEHDCVLFLKLHSIDIVYFTSSTVTLLYLDFFFVFWKTCFQKYLSSFLIFDNSFILLTWIKFFHFLCIKKKYLV